MNEIAIGVEALTEQQVLAVARHDARVRLNDEARKAIGASRDVIEELAGDPEPHYGISTGFGALATKQIAPDDRVALQRSLIRSHAAGSGPEVEREVVRALMLLRLSTLATGRTGVRLETAETYAAMLNAGITPVVYEFGSLGCSGDLAPLAHCALAAMGEGTVRVGGEARPAADALAAAGITPVVLREKEGLALTNGVDGMLGMLTLATDDLALLFRTADLAAAMSVEAQLGTDAVFAADLQALRPHPGQADSAANLRALLAGSAHHGQPPHRRLHPRAGRLLAALLAAGARRRPRHARARPPGARPRARQRRRQPRRHARRPGREQRQLPRRARRLRARLPRHRRGRPRLDRRAAHRPVPRPRPQPRPAAVPRRRPRASTRVT